METAEIDLLNIGYASGSYINGYHWYSDPFDLYSEYNVDHFLELLGESFNYTADTSVVASDQSMYFLAMILRTPEPEPVPTPVPEPNSTLFLITGLIFLFLFNKNWSIHRTPKNF